ncbi:hypothetical protein HK102_013928 [Quaeritorhiza haematococci]|nr:hypothetical protein HK102_013928 [Quaeritorhiza haematococci]
MTQLGKIVKDRITSVMSNLHLEQLTLYIRRGVVSEPQAGIATSQGLSAHLSIKHPNYAATSKAATSLLSLAIQQQAPSQQTLPPILESQEDDQTYTPVEHRDGIQENEGESTKLPSTIIESDQNEPNNKDHQAKNSEDVDFFENVKLKKEFGVYLFCIILTPWFD